MGQIWEVINVDRRERGLASSRKLSEFLFWEQSQMEFLYTDLRTPCLPDAVEGWLSRGNVLPQPGSIGKLSTDVLDMIFQVILGNPSHSSTTNLLTCICLAIACKGLLAVGKRHILKGLIAYHARAVDCRLVCLGKFTRNATNQAPPGMLTEEELKEIAGPDPTSEHCLYDFAMEHYDYARRGWRERCQSLKMERCRFHFWDVPGRPWVLKEHRDPRDYRMIEQLTDRVSYTAGPNVLLNLVKGEYVREAALIVFKNDPDRVTLAHALLSRICYSQDPSVADQFCGEEFVGRFGQGPWAGNRFRIVSEGDMPAPGQIRGGFTEWIDVTGEVNRLLGNLWRKVGCKAEVLCG